MVQQLRRLKGEQAQRRLSMGEAYCTARDLVCYWDDGAPLRPDYVSHAFARLVRQAGLPAVRYHNLRHTHATWLMKQGVHPKIASERLVHSSIGVTMNLYSHATPDMQTEAAERLDQALRRAMEDETRREMMVPTLTTRVMLARCWHRADEPATFNLI